MLVIFICFASIHLHLLCWLVSVRFKSVHILKFSDIMQHQFRKSKFPYFWYFACILHSTICVMWRCINSLIWLHRPKYARRKICRWILQSALGALVPSLIKHLPLVCMVVHPTARSPTPDQNVPRSCPSLKNTPFSRILGEKNILILRSNKTPLFKGGDRKFTTVQWATENIYCSNFFA